MSKPTRLASALLLLTLFSALPGARGVLGQQSYPSNFSRSIAESGAVRDALAWLESNFESQVEEWVRITEIPAKSGSEGERAAFLKGELEREGVDPAIDEALKCKESGEKKTIVFNMCGHGHFDMAAYDAYFGKQLEDYEYPEAAVEEALKELPQVPA